MQSLCMQNEPSQIKPASPAATKTEPKVCVRKLMLKRRQKKRALCGQNSSVPSYICVDDYVSTQPPPKQWIPALDLLDSDKIALMDRSDWITDSIVDAAQSLIGELCPIGGLQKVCCGMSMAFTVEPTEFIQILCTGYNHWILISTLGTVHPTVMVYDSLYCTVNSFVERQIATLLNTNAKEVDLQFVNVQMQYGGTDCGIFAIAFATALALGHAPESLHFKQDSMRQHLLECLQSRKMTMFPCDRTRRANKRMKNVQKMNVYCTCRLPEFGEMIKCSCCKEWFHLDLCVNVPCTAKKRNVVWKCSLCVNV